MNNVSTTRRKRRPASACEPCRRKKIKCDRNCPCEHCARAKNEYCSYLVHSEGNDGLVISRSLNSTKAALNTNGVNLHRRINGGHKDVADRVSSTTRGTTSREVHVEKHVSNLPVPFNGEQRKVAATTRQPTSHECGEVRKAISVERENSVLSAITEENWVVRGIFSKNRFFGQSHWVNSVHQFPEVYKVMNDFETDKNNESRLAYEACEKLAKNTKNIPSPPTAVLLDQIPPRKIVEKLVQAYLRTFESVLRILHVPSFLEECNNYWAYPEMSSDEFMIQLILVMAIGIGFCPERTSYTASSWINVAQAWLGTPTEEHRISISGVQIYCLLLLARQSNNVGADFIWISAGSLLRTAMHIGLHIDPSQLPEMSFYDQEIRRRLWATILEITIQSAMDSGGAPLISIADFNCASPSNVADEDFDKDIRTPPYPKPFDQFTQTSAQIALMESFPLRLKIAGAVNDFRSECPYDEVLQLSSQLSAYCQTNFVRFHREDRPQRYIFSARLLELLMLRFLLALHHPFAMKARKDPTLYFSRKVSIEVSLSLIGRFCLNGNAPPGEKDYARLGMIGAGIFRSVPVQAASTICEDLIRQLEEEAFSFTPVSNSFSHLNLRKVVEEYSDLLHVRLRISETTINGCLKFASLLGQIDALQNGASVEHGIVNALKKDLERCQQILQSRTDDSWVHRTDSAFAGNEQLDDLISAVDGDQDWLGSDETNAMINFDSWLSANVIQ